MKNKDQKVSRREVLELINRSVGLHEKSFFLSKKMFSTIEKLQKSVSGIIFLIIILYWRVFLWNPIRNFLQSTFSQWGNLSEGWQIFTLSIPVLIISTVLSNILSHLVINKFKKDIS